MENTQVLTPAQEQVKELLGGKFEEFKSLSQIYVQGGSNDVHFVIALMMTMQIDKEGAEKLLDGLKVYMKYFPENQLNNPIKK
jgi:hypothetical protein